MKLTTSLIQVALALLTVALLLIEVAANPIQDTATPSDTTPSHPYPITPIRFEGSIRGIHLNTTGTIEEIYAEAAKDPQFFAF
ncbi:hypothetical protein IFR05_009484 [Cadophora sp. M221]|nr:hypothetical protein IFR05_009484 [Cadophora sp. M221]